MTFNSEHYAALHLPDAGKTSFDRCHILSHSGGEYSVTRVFQGFGLALPAVENFSFVFFLLLYLLRGLYVFISRILQSVVVLL